jgi:hypothetical protein
MGQPNYGWRLAALTVVLYAANFLQPISAEKELSKNSFQLLPNYIGESAKSDWNNVFRMAFNT